MSTVLFAQSAQPQAVAIHPFVIARSVATWQTVASEYGTKYIVTGGLATPDGRNPQPIVKAVWIQDQGQDGVRFVTAYPQRS